MGNNHKVEVTASPDEAFYFAEKNIPYIVYLNDENKGKSFPNGAYCVENLNDIDELYMEKIYRRFRQMPWDIAETERLRIREITVSDVPRLYELYADESITKYMESLFPKMEQEIEYTKNYIQNIYKFYGYGMWIIEEKKSGMVIGRAGLEYREGNEGLELGFMLGVDYQHKGYAYEACKAVLKYGKDELYQEKYCAHVNVNNIQSIRLCEKLGFEKSGYMNDMIFFTK
jgi:RimJ/RimL family protein N-acetyltransferase